MLTKEQLLQLRKEIVLNSLYFNDYKNSFGIDKNLVYNFFDSYMEYLQELETENNENLPINEFFNKYDTSENLIEYYFYCFDYDPLVID